MSEITGMDHNQICDLIQSLTSERNRLLRHVKKAISLMEDSGASETEYVVFATLHGSLGEPKVPEPVDGTITVRPVEPKP